MQINEDFLSRFPTEIFFASNVKKSMIQNRTYYELFILLAKQSNFFVC